MFDNLILGQQKETSHEKAGQGIFKLPRVIVNGEKTSRQKACPAQGRQTCRRG